MARGSHDPRAGPFVGARSGRVSSVCMVPPVVSQGYASRVRERAVVVATMTLSVLLLGGVAYGWNVANEPEPRVVCRVGYADFMSGGGGGPSCHAEAP